MRGGKETKKSAESVNKRARERVFFFLSLSLSLSSKRQTTRRRRDEEKEKFSKERERERGGFLSLKTKRASNEQFDVVSRSLFFLLHHLFSSIALSLSLCVSKKSTD